MLQAFQFCDCYITINMLWRLFFEKLGSCFTVLLFCSYFLVLEGFSFCSNHCGVTFLLLLLLVLLLLFPSF